MTTHWHAFSNVSGYLSESDHASDSYATWDEARAALRSDLEFARDGLDYAWGDQDGRLCRESASLTRAIADLDSADAGAGILLYTDDGGEHTIPTAWQVTDCHSPECEPPGD